MRGRLDEMAFRKDFPGRGIDECPTDLDRQAADARGFAVVEDGLATFGDQLHQRLTFLRSARRCGFVSWMGRRNVLGLDPGTGDDRIERLRPAVMTCREPASLV